MNQEETRLLHQPLTEHMLGNFFSTYNALGFGYLETVYQTALAIVLRASGLQVERDVPLEIFFRGAVIASDKADVIVENKVLLELKSARLISPEHEAQLMNYLRCTGIEVGLLLNFGPRPQFKRIVFSNSRKRSFHSPTDA